jgi:hypothetical protein
LRAAGRFDCFGTTCVINKEGVSNGDDELEPTIELISDEELVDLELVVLEGTEGWDDDDEELD